MIETSHYITILEAITPGTDWRVMTQSAADIYAQGCEALLYCGGGITAKFMLVKKPLPSDPNGPAWAASIDSCDTFLATGDNFLDLVAKPEVQAQLRGAVE